MLVIIILFYCTFRDLEIPLIYLFQLLVEASLISGETENGIRSAPYLNFSDRDSSTVAVVAIDDFLGASRRSLLVISGCIKG